MIKRISVNIVLIVGFGLLIGVIVLPFVAQVQFETAKRLEEDYRWRRAGEKYQAAVHLDPFNAEYFAGAGDFMARQSKYRGDKVLWLGRAEKLYERAGRLNPRYAQYQYLLGEVRLELNETDSAIGNFREAIEKDPYNFRNNYLVGHNLLTVWNTLDEEEKSFALDRLRYVLRLNPWYSSFIHPAIMYYAEDFSVAQRVTPQTLAGHKRLYSFMAKNNLWQYRKGQKQLVDFYRQKEQPQEFKQERAAKWERIKELKEKNQPVGGFISRKDWQGKSKGGKSTYKNGNMYWTGTMDTVIDMPKGKAKINIKARGSVANEIFPYMIVELDGEETGETFVDSPEWKEYSFEVDTEGGLRVLSVTFANDGWNKERGENRNLYVGKTQITQILNTDYTDER